MPKLGFKFDVDKQDKNKNKFVELRQLRPFFNHDEVDDEDDEINKDEMCCEWKREKSENSNNNVLVDTRMDSVNALLCIKKKTSGNDNENEWLVVAADDSCIKIWSMRSGGGTRQVKWVKTLAGHRGRINDLALLPILNSEADDEEEDSVLLSASSDMSVRVWGVREGVALGLFGGEQQQHTWPVNALAVANVACKRDNDNNTETVQMVCASSGTSVKVSEGQTGKWLFTLTGHKHVIGAMLPLPHCTNDASSKRTNHQLLITGYIFFIFFITRDSRSSLFL
jgi:WD40 repeat protein